VITSGMLRVLSGPERDVLLAHERSHAAGSHYLFTSNWPRRRRPDPDPGRHHG
jgi:hypothetical protein